MEDVDENDPSEADDGAPATPPRLPDRDVGEGDAHSRKPEAYIPSTKGKKYELGVLNLCYRGNWYKLKDGVLSVNVDSLVSESEAASYKARACDEFDTNVEVLGIIMIHQYNLKKGLELFGVKAR